MKHLFYLVGIIFIIKEMLWIFYPKSEVEKREKLKEGRKNNKGKSWDQLDKDYKDLLSTTGLFGLIVTIWMFVGLFSFNWIAFLMLLVFNFVIIAPISKLVEKSPLYIILHWINSVIGFCFGLFIIINSYHLKINLYELFLSWIN